MTHYKSGCKKKGSNKLAKPIKSNYVLIMWQCCSSVIDGNLSPFVCVCAWVCVCVCVLQSTAVLWIYLAKLL